jgi:predicted ABC-type ATPase
VAKYELIPGSGRLRVTTRADVVKAAQEILPARSSLSFNDWVQMFNYGGVQYPYLPSMSLGQEIEPPDPTFAGYVRGAYKSNGVVFACMAARMLLFSEARFQFRQLRSGRPGDLFGTTALRPLEEPWPNGTTGDLLSRAINDADLAGNFYAVGLQERIYRLRPDWVTIVLGSRLEPDDPQLAVDCEVLGYIYRPGGVPNAEQATVLRAEQVAHFAPYPDPEARYRGMSWITPVIREIMADQAATNHSQQYFEKGATPNIAVSLDPAVTGDEFLEFVRMFEQRHSDLTDAYRTIFLGGGATITPVGSTMQQADFANTRGTSETRICMAARVPPIIVGTEVGLRSSTYSNYGEARRAFADLTMRPMWRQIAGAFASIIDVPDAAELWYDDRDVAFLQEDVKDGAEIMEADARSIRTLSDGGFDPQSVVDAVVAGDLRRLKHSGLLPVQVQPPGSPKPGSEPKADGGSNGKPATEDAAPSRRVLPFRAGYVESQHPRDPGGQHGGEWIAKGTTAEGAVASVEATAESVGQALEDSKAQIASKAQEVYDAWSQDEEGADDEYGGGGICDAVNGEIQGVIAGWLPEGVEIVDGGAEGEDHAWTIVVGPDFAYNVDIPPGVYESGGGYSWKKIPGVTIGPDHVAIDRLPDEWVSDLHDMLAGEGGDEYMSDIQAEIIARAGYKAGQPRDPGGDFGGRWVKAGTAAKDEGTKREKVKASKASAQAKLAKEAVTKAPKPEVPVKAPERAGGGSGIPIPADLNEWERWDAELVPVKAMMPLRDQVETTDPEKIAKLLADILKEGIREPITLDHSVTDGRTYVSEGNNRLEAARDAGYVYVPVRVITVGKVAERHGGRMLPPVRTVMTTDAGEVDIPQYTFPSAIGLPVLQANGPYSAMTGHPVTLALDGLKEHLAETLVENVVENLGRATWDESKHPRDPGGEKGGEWISKGATAADDPREPGSTEPAVVEGDTLDEMLRNMGAMDLEIGPETHPERYMIHPKSGFTVANPDVTYTMSVPPRQEDGGKLPPRVVDVRESGMMPPKDYPDAKPLGFGRWAISEPRPPDYLFRAVSEAEYQGILKRGYMQSDQRMNLSQAEGTVTAFSNPSYYLPGALASDKPGTYEGRIIRIGYRDEDGWRHDTDDYVKTSKPVPASRIDMVTPKLVRQVTPRPGKDWNDIGPWEKARAYVESEHPRDPGGPGGGQWIKKGTTAAGAATTAPAAGVEPGQVVKGDTAERLLGEARDTQELYLGEDGRYVPERLALQDEIIGHFLDAAHGEVQQNPATLFMIGGTASGKSTAIGRFDEEFPNAVLVNPDEIKEMLPEYQEMIEAGDSYAAWGTHEESSDIAKKLLSVVNERNYNAIVDGTGDSGPGVFEGKVAKAEAAGRRTKVVYVDVPTDVAVERAMTRARKTGRMVPESEIRKIHQAVAARHAEWAGNIGDWEVWATESGEPRMIAEREHGDLIVYDKGRYQQTLDKGKSG